MKTVTILFSLFLLLFSAAVPDASSADLLIVDSAAGEPYKTVRESMLTELETLGYKDGVNLNVKYWSLGNSEGMAKRVWLEEKDQLYDAVFINGTIAAIHFHKFADDNENYNFVFGAVTDPIGLGLIDSFETPPKSNFTGVCYPVKIEDRLRFIKKTMPAARDIGFIYADMPQSTSYVNWIKKALLLDEFKSFRFHFRVVPFVKTEGGHIRMAMLAKKHIRELDPKVDLFLSPNDQMGAQEPFAQAVSETAETPLVGLGRDDVMENWGAAMSLYPSLTSAGKQVAGMLHLILTGTNLKKIKPQWPATGVAFNLNKAEKHHISIPEELIIQAGQDIIR